MSTRSLLVAVGLVGVGLNRHQDQILVAAAARVAQVLLILRWLLLNLATQKHILLRHPLVVVMALQRIRQTDQTALKEILQHLRLALALQL